MELPTVENIRDVGVLVDSRLSFHDHMNSIVSRGHVPAEQIWRCFMCKDVYNLIKAFTTYVGPMLGYCSSVWSPVSPNLVNHVESVQRRFTKRLPGFRSLVYNERCARLGIERLELRRLHADLTMCFKIVHGLMHCSLIFFFKY